MKEETVKDRYFCFLHSFLAFYRLNEKIISRLILKINLSWSEYQFVFNPVVLPLSEISSGWGCAP